eukprot:8610724-Pyramimonas_sp.AAC.1
MPSGAYGQPDRPEMSSNPAREASSAANEAHRALQEAPSVNISSDDRHTGGLGAKIFTPRSSRRRPSGASRRPNRPRYGFHDSPRGIQD